MKQAKFILLAIVVFSTQIATAQVAINNNGAPPDSSAILDLSGSDKGFLLPRMSLEQRDAIQNPATGLLIYCLDCVELQIFNGESWTNILGGLSASNVETVINPVTGREWMDRNLGATEIPTSINDPNGFGDLYQWGRSTDGHEKRNSPTIDILSGGDEPGHDKFIVVTGQPYDWKDPQNIYLWQGAMGTNNPCPSQFRIPTEEEWEAERATWDTPNAAGAFASVLKLPLAGSREYLYGDVANEGAFGNYWISDVQENYTRYLELNAYTVGEYGTFRAYGFSVRCIRD